MRGVHRRSHLDVVSPSAEKGDLDVCGISAGERETIARQTGCVSDLNGAPAAKRGLASLGAVEGFIAPVRCRNNVRGAQ